VVLDDFERGLRLYLSDPAAARDAVACGQALITKNHTDEAAGKRWLAILSSYAGARTRGASAATRALSETRRLFLIDTAADLRSLGPLIEEAKQNGANAMVIVTANTGGASSEITKFLIRQSIIPTLASAEELEAGDARWLRNADAVILAAESPTPEHRTAQALATLARRHKVEVTIVTTGAKWTEHPSARPLISVPGGEDTASRQSSG
jgi:hypothetical protein